MATPARFEQPLPCLPAAVDIAPLTHLIPRQRDEEFSSVPSSHRFERPASFVPELGQIITVHSRLVQLPDDAQPRLRRTMAIELGDVRHCARSTEPTTDQTYAADPLETIVLMHGCSEMIDGGTGKNLHDALAPHFPDKRIVSIATDGVGRYCQKIGWRQGLSKNFRSMAVDRHRLINALKGSGSVSIFVISMGSMISLELLDFNSSLPDEAVTEDGQDRRLSINVVVNHSSAHVTAKRIVPDVMMRFPPHIWSDSLKMQRRLKAIPVGQMAVVKAIPRSLPALAGNGINIFRGVKAEKINAAARNYMNGYISGADDPLGQHKQTRRLQQLYPETVLVETLAGTGHAACMDGRKTAADFARMYTKLSNHKAKLVSSRQ